MALHDNPPHSVTIQAPTSSRDGAGGTNLSYTTVQADVPCSIDTADPREVERFAAMQLVVTHTVGILSSVLSTPLARGSKLVSGSSSFHVQGISTGRAYGSIPAFTYAHCEEVLG